MTGPGGSDLLTTWERGRGLHEIDRAMLLLAAGQPSRPTDELASLSLADRDADLLRLRAATFGPAMAAATECDACGTTLELRLDAEELLSARDLTPAGDAPRAVDVDGGRLRVRPPTSHDLAAIVGMDDPEEARLALARRCLVDGDAAPDRAALARIAEAAGDALADQVLVVDLVCPSCGHRSEVDLDPAAFLWVEVDAEAARLLHEVDTLARAYGWRERDILEMTPGRRRAYVELAG